MLEEWLSIAKAEGLVQPTVYQSQYNLLCRAYESELFPLLRKNNMRFTAFSPLAGGFLLGNFTSSGVQSGSRFANAEGPFRKWYDKPSMHAAVTRLREIAEKEGVGMDELALRWVVHHSILGEEDAVILGASRVEQIEKNAAQIEKGPLDDALVRELDALWDGVKHDGIGIVDRFVR